MARIQFTGRYGRRARVFLWRRKLWPCASRIADERRSISPGSDRARTILVVVGPPKRNSMSRCRADPRWRQDIVVERAALKFDKPKPGEPLFREGRTNCFPARARKARPTRLIQPHGRSSGAVAILVMPGMPHPIRSLPTEWRRIRNAARELCTISRTPSGELAATFSRGDLRLAFSRACRFAEDLTYSIM